MKDNTNHIELKRELDRLRIELEEANDTIEAIRNGEIDALVLKGEEGHQIYTLKSADQTYRMFIEKMNEGAVTLNDQGIIIYCNSAFAEMVELPLSKVISMSFTTIIDPADKKIFEKALQTVTQFKSKGEISLIKNSGGITPCLFSLSSLTLDDGEATSIILTDLSFQKETERQLEKKDEFISMVSHELKTPVTSLKGYTQLMMMSLQQKGGQGLDEYLSTMDMQINKLTRLISDLLDATKSEAGHLTFTKNNFNFNPLAEEVAKELQHTTSKHFLNIQLAEDVVIYGDRNRIGQVITNLISNAIKYSPDAKDVYVSSLRKDDQLIFSVRDEGIGIAKEEQPNLYTRFYRGVLNNSSHTFPGMGLGLYISKTIIDKHDGTMGVESMPGKGSTFYFSLPVSAV